MTVKNNACLCRKEYEMKILIVDDEKLARDAIECIIVSANCEMNVCAKASNEKEAFAMYKEYSPDVVITDICMDGVGGLNLIEEIRSYDENSNIIVLSAYEKFEYAKKAYESGAEFYLLKPIDEDELIRKLLIIKERVESDKKGINDKAKYLDVVREKYFKELFTNSFAEVDNFNEICNVFGIKSFKSFVVAKVCIANFYGLTKEEQKEAEESLIITIEHFEDMHGDKCVKIKMSDCEWAVVEFFDEEKDENAIVTNLQGVFLSLQEQFALVFDKTTISIGLSNIYSNPQYIYDAYNEANEMIYSTAWQGKGSIINKGGITSYENQVIYMTKDELEKIYTSCLSNDTEGAFENVDEYFERIRRIRYVEIRVICNAVAEAIISIIRNITKNESDMQHIFEERTNLFSEMQNCKNLDELAGRVKEKISKVLEYTKTTSESETLRKIVNIVNRDYAKPITVEDVAEELHFSSSYLMRLFKYETGQTFHTYLTEYRIKKAAELLKNENLKVSEVSELVGYTDSNYFGQVFKRIMGIPPQKYVKGLK